MLNIFTLPDVLRNMFGQITQNPTMMNTVNQIAQQIDGNQDLSNMFFGMGGGGGGGGFDLSGMKQQMMPIVAQTFGGGGSGLNMPQQPPLQPRSINDSSSAPQVCLKSFVKMTNDVFETETETDVFCLQLNLRDLAKKIEHHESPYVVFSSVVEAAARVNNNNNGDELSELLIQEGLVDVSMSLNFFFLNLLDWILELNA